MHRSLKMHWVIGAAVLAMFGTAASPLAQARPPQSLLDAMVELHALHGDDRGKKRDRDDRGEEREADAISLDRAVEIAQKRFRARVVRAETVVSGGRRVHLLRLLSEEDGRVWSVRVDAQTGEIR